MLEPLAPALLCGAWGKHLAVLFGRLPGRLQGVCPTSTSSTPPASSAFRPCTALISTLQRVPSFPSGPPAAWSNCPSARPTPPCPLLPPSLRLRARGGGVPGLGTQFLSFQITQLASPFPLVAFGSFPGRQRELPTWLASSVRCPKCRPLPAVWVGAGAAQWPWVALNLCAENMKQPAPRSQCHGVPVQGAPCAQERWLT